MRSARKNTLQGAKKYGIINELSGRAACNRQRYRSGHNGADSKFFEELAVCSAKKARKIRVFPGSKIKYFVVLSVSSFQKFSKEMRNHIHGELSEWSKVQHSKSSGHLVVSSPQNPYRIRLFAGSNN